MTGVQTCALPIYFSFWPAFVQKQIVTFLFQSGEVGEEVGIIEMDCGGRKKNGENNSTQ